MTDRKLPELTPAWFRVAMTPRHQPDGSILRTLTPPTRRGSGLAPPVILLGIAILSAVAFIFGTK